MFDQVFDQDQDSQDQDQDSQDQDQDSQDQGQDSQNHDPVFLRFSYIMFRINP